MENCLQSRVGLLVSLLIAGAAFSVHAAPDAISLDHRLANLRTALEPEFWDGRLLLTYQPARPRTVRYVGVRFEHEDWRELHVFARKERFEDVLVKDPETGSVTSVHRRRPDGDLFYFIHDDVPIDGIVRYRIVVDGLWMTDPQNPIVEADPKTGLSFSVARSLEPVLEPVFNPRFLPDGRVRLTYRGDTGKNVSVAGDFNGWDPYTHPLLENPPGSGTYTVEMRVPRGTQRYVFYVGGNRVEDPLNRDWRLDSDGRPLYLVQNQVGP